ncbi:hypothetical protein H633G_03152 [Metarhizium anisopliae BRIP 53284]|nr:hypothetical protein H633G_03152 [Metarhizium anisopliae BRIP 53284]
MQILELPRATGRHFRPPSRKKIAKELFRSLYPPEHRSPRDTISLLNITDKKRKYTDFWGPVSNFGIPVAAVLDTQKSPDLISGQMTGALCIYSATFMRYSLAVTPKNYLLFACHFVNECAQLTQGYRYLSYHHWGGKEKTHLEKGIEAAKNKVEGVEDKVKSAVGK